MLLLGFLMVVVFSLVIPMTLGPALAKGILTLADDKLQEVGCVRLVYLQQFLLVIGVGFYISMIISLEEQTRGTKEVVRLYILYYIVILPVFLFLLSFSWTLLRPWALKWLKCYEAQAKRAKLKRGRKLRRNP